MAESKLNDMITASLENIREIADANTIIGNPIEVNGTVIIPVSKVSLGFASGGTDFLSKNGAAVKAADSQNAAKGSVRVPCFGGGGGTGVSITPVCFVVVKKDGETELLDLAGNVPTPAAVSIVDTISGLIEKSPELITKVKTTFGKKKDADDLDDEEIEEGADRIIDKELAKEAKKAEKEAKKAEKAAMRAEKKAEKEAEKKAEA
ncbi:MAG: hypothetical protein MJ070_08770 [Lachnospiraceae bacterium]|nr:hypothetical protein [Lachnospiraceae bacterium]